MGAWVGWWVFAYAHTGSRWARARTHLTDPRHTTPNQPTQDMLAMVQDVFGKHTDMFDEFKMILNARGATDSVQNDLWYSMPLSEIDFSQVGPFLRVGPACFLVGY